MLKYTAGTTVGANKKRGSRRMTAFFKFSGFGSLPAHFASMIRFEQRSSPISRQKFSAFARRNELRCKFKMMFVKIFLGNVVHVPVRFIAFPQALFVSKRMRLISFSAYKQDSSESIVVNQ